MHDKLLQSCLTFCDPMNIACQGPLSMGFSRQEYWNGLPCPSPEEMATHSSVLAWKIPWTEEPGRLQSMGSQRVGHNWETSLSLSLSPGDLPDSGIEPKCPASPALQADSLPTFPQLIPEDHLNFISKIIVFNSYGNNKILVIFWLCFHCLCEPIMSHAHHCGKWSYSITVPF